MSRRIRGLKLSPALVVSVLAVVLASAGTAVASKLITGKDIRNGTITSQDVKDGTLKTRDIGKGRVTLDRLSPGVRAALAKAGKPGKSGATGAMGATGAAGPQGSAGAQGPQGAEGPAIPADFSYTNASVTLTRGGIKFGPYSDGGAAGGSLRYDGLNGHKLSDITKLVYTAKYSTDDDVDVAVPYLRVFLNEDQHDVIFSPNTQPTKTTAEDVFHAWDVTAGTARYDDDAGNAPDQPWADVVAAHGDDVISGIYVSTGFTAGQDLRAFLSDFAVNGVAFHFGD